MDDREQELREQLDEADAALNAAHAALRAYRIEKYQWAVGLRIEWEGTQWEIRSVSVQYGECVPIGVVVKKDGTIGVRQRDHWYAGYKEPTVWDRLKAIKEAGNGNHGA